MPAGNLLNGAFSTSTLDALTFLGQTIGIGGNIIGLAVAAAGLVGLAILAVLVVGIYNKLVKLRNRYQNQFSQIDVQLKRRHDLIPNLVETAKGYMAHEKDTLEAVLKARASATQAVVNVGNNPDAASMKQLAAAEGGLQSALGRLMAVAENYPDLKANSTMQQVMEELTSTENKISFARQGYNDSAQTYKTYRESFPQTLFAGMLGFGDAAFFEIEDASHREAAEVKF